MNSFSASIVVACYNSGKVLREVIAGMGKLEYPGTFEVIFVNDGSHDGTRKILDSIRVVGKNTCAKGGTIHPEWEGVP